MPFGHVVDMTDKYLVTNGLCLILPCLYWPFEGAFRLAMYERAFIINPYMTAYAEYSDSLRRQTPAENGKTPTPSLTRRPD